jgi:hypothetical protein
MGSTRLIAGNCYSPYCLATSAGQSETAVANASPTIRDGPRVSSPRMRLKAAGPPVRRSSTGVGIGPQATGPCGHVSATAALAVVTTATAAQGGTDWFARATDDRSRGAVPARWLALPKPILEFAVTVRPVDVPARIISSSFRSAAGWPGATLDKTSTSTKAIARIAVATTASPPGRSASRHIPGESWPAEGGFDSASPGPRRGGVVPCARR